MDFKFRCIYVFYGIVEVIKVVGCVVILLERTDDCYQGYPIDIDLWLFIAGVVPLASFALTLFAVGLLALCRILKPKKRVNLIKSKQFLTILIVIELTLCLFYSIWVPVGAVAIVKIPCLQPLVGIACTMEVLLVFRGIVMFCKYCYVQ